MKEGKLDWSGLTLLVRGSLAQSEDPRVDPTRGAPKFHFWFYVWATRPIQAPEWLSSGRMHRRCDSPPSPERHDTWHGVGCHGSPEKLPDGIRRGSDESLPEPPAQRLR